MFLWPWGNTQQLNLDWFLSRFNFWEEEIPNELNAEVERVEDAMSDLYQARDDSQSYSQQSEAWAVGTIDGVAVDNTAPQYSNNSKYWSDSSQQSATGALVSKQLAENSEQQSEAWAAGTINGTPVSSAAPQYNNNAKYYANLSGGMIARTEATTTASVAHGVGTYFVLNGLLYITTQTITAGDTIIPDTNCKNVVLSPNLASIAELDLMGYALHGEKISDGITYSAINRNTYNTDGILSGTSFYSLFTSNTSIYPFIAGHDYFVYFDSEEQSTILQLYKYVSGVLSYVTYLKPNKCLQKLTIPADADGLILRYRVNDNVSNKKIYCYIFPENPLVKNTVEYLPSIDVETSTDTGKIDRKAEIEAALNTAGYCKLGEGIFYVSGIEMPEGACLEGCGEKTVIKLLDNISTGFAIKMCKHNTVKNLTVKGAYSFTMPPNLGTRNGIEFIANTDGSDPGSSYTSEQCYIENIRIYNFTGSGIYCHNTSINYAKGVYVANVHINPCYCGINIDYKSEFNKFTNVCTAWCVIGCINNGGNNVFTACTFHATDTGFYIDGTKPNSGHGTLNGCTFCHIGSNAGKAIEIVSCSNGFIIANCQIWYNSIVITNSASIVIEGCELGRGTTNAGATIVITGGDTVLFIGCIFYNDVTYPPDITKTPKTIFSNCYGGTSGNAITG